MNHKYLQLQNIYVGILLELLNYILPKVIFSSSSRVLQNIINRTSPYYSAQSSNAHQTIFVFHIRPWRFGERFFVLSGMEDFT